MRGIPRTLVAGALIFAAIAFVVGLVRGDDAQDLARARAEASVVVAKVTLGRRACTSTECQAAQDKACQLVNSAVAKPAAPPAKPAPTSSLSPDGRTLTDAAGQVFTRRADGTFWPSSPSAPPAIAAPATPTDDGCQTINGRKVCPVRH